MNAAPTPRLSIAIVTPSFNQGAFCEEAIRSVLDQDYPKLEYVIMDGGSTDRSVEVIRRYESRLTAWTSCPDGGQYPAINAGFAQTTGEVMGWLNADDKYLPWTFSVVAEVFAQFAEIEWLTTRWPLRWDRQGRAVRCAQRAGYSRESFFRGGYVPGESRPVIQQESTFWRRSLWDRAGGKLDTSYAVGGDFELWSRFFQLTHLYAVDTPLGGFRTHGNQRSVQQREQYAADVQRALQERGGRTTARWERIFRRRRPAPIVRFNKDTEAWAIETIAVS